MIDEQKVKQDEDWMSKKWRPMMAMMYMFCCLCDFAIFPILFTLVQFWEVQAANDAFRQWVPITLQGGGLFHVAMGAVLGVSAYGRTQEKVAGVANNVTPDPIINQTPTIQPAPVAPVVVVKRVESPAISSDINIGFGGKKAPPPAVEPLI